MAIHLMVAKVVIPIITGFSGLLPIMVTSDLLAITDSVLEISEMDRSTFTLARREVPTF